jgi:hypothetical protein
LTEWIILWPCGVSLTGKYMFGPPVSDKFQNALGDGSRLNLTTGPDPVLERAICHLLANGHMTGARLFERRPVFHYAARLARPRTNDLWPVVGKRVMTRFEMGSEVFSRMRCATGSPLPIGSPSNEPYPFEKHSRCPFFGGTRAALRNDLCIGRISAI